MFAEDAVELGHVGLDGVDAAFHVHKARLHLGIEFVDAHVELIDAKVKAFEPALVEQNAQEDGEDRDSDGNSRRA